MHDKKWEKTISNIKGFVPRIVYGFYINRSDQIDKIEVIKLIPPYFGKVYVKGLFFFFLISFLG